MHRRIFSLLIAMFLLGSNASKADTPEEFLATYRTALEQKNTNKLLSLYYTNGCSEFDITGLKEMEPINHFFNGKLTNVSFAPISKDWNPIHIADGKKYEPTHSVDGVIKFFYVSQPENAQSTHYSGGDGYAVIDGIHRLITAKSTNLGWKGPKDQQLNFTVTGKGGNKCEIQYKWNASGVDQQAALSGNSGIVLLGQFIESIHVTSLDDDTDLILTVREGGKEIYTSSPLKGKGTLEYKRQVQK